MPPDVERARKLRREMSYPEVLLWQRLRGSPLGVRFRRQHPIGSGYIADFYCSAASLVVEVDGKVHDSVAAQTFDQSRDSFLASRGLKVTRVAAADVLRDADGVAGAILAFAATPLHPRAPHDGAPPRAGEEQE